MASQQDPNFGINFDWDLGEDGWNTGMDSNLKKLGATAFLHVISATTTAQPGLPTNGDRYIVPDSATGADWLNNDGKLAVCIESVWEFYTPSKGWTARVGDDLDMLTYDGTDWIATATIKDYKITGSTDKDDIAFNDLTMIAELSTITNTTVSFLASNSRYLFVLDGTTALRVIDRFSGTVVKTLSGPSFGAIGASETHLVLATASALRVYDLKTWEITVYSATGPGADIREVRSFSGGNTYTVNGSDLLSVFGSDFLISDTQTLAGISEQVASFYVEDDKIYSVDASLASAGNLIVREHDVSDGSLTQSSATFTQTTNSGYTASIAPYGRDYLVVIYRRSGSNSYMEVLLKSDLTTVYSGNIAMTMSKATFVNGLMYAFVDTGTEADIEIYQIPALAHALPAHMDLNNLSSAVINCDSKKYSFCDFAKAVEDVNYLGDVLSEAAVDSVQASASAATVDFNNHGIIELYGNDNASITLTIEEMSKPGKRVLNFTHGSTTPTSTLTLVTNGTHAVYGDISPLTGGSAGGKCWVEIVYNGTDYTFYAISTPQIISS